MNKPILIIDDDQAICEELKEVLTEEGYAVTVACDGKSAHEALCQKEFPLILLDVKLPDINGLEILRIVKQNKPQVKVIVLTGSLFANGEDETFIVDTNGFKEKAVLADCIFCKPVNMEQILEKIKQFIG